MSNYVLQQTEGKEWDGYHCPPEWEVVEIVTRNPAKGSWIGRAVFSSSSKIEAMAELHLLQQAEDYTMFNDQECEFDYV